MLRRPTMLAVLLACAAATPALAQTDPTAMARVAAANQLGVLQYCQAQGYSGADAVSAEQDSISQMPASSAPTADAEALGRQGTFAAPNGAKMTLASMASAHSTTVASMCQQMASATIQSAAALKQNGMSAGGMPSMPAMPGGMPTMPAMPAMPGGMPAMPGGMPAMPGTATGK